MGFPMTGQSIFIIRHAEKPEEGETVPAFDENRLAGALTLRGWQRAGAWAALLSLGLDAYAAPELIYAPSPRSRRADGTKPSQRSYLTMLPLSRRLNRAVEARFAEGERTTSCPRFSRWAASRSSHGSTRESETGYCQAYSAMGSTACMGPRAMT